VHYWADLQSEHGFRCYDNIVPDAKRQRALVLALCLFTVAALHCCKAHSEINRKMENLTPCKVVTPENFILKLGTRDYAEDVTYYTIFDVDRFSWGFSPNR